jgi:hypothetical protein
MISSKPVFLPSARSIRNISQCTTFGGKVIRQGVPPGGNAGTEVTLPSSKLKLPRNTLSDRFGRSYNASSVTGSAIRGSPYLILLPAVELQVAPRAQARWPSRWVRFRPGAPLRVHASMAPGKCSMKRGRPFEPGNQFGRGRPLGSRNKKTLAVQHLLEEHSESVLRKALVRALEGDSPMLQTLLSYILARPKDAPLKPECSGPERRRRFPKVLMPF